MNWWDYFLIVISALCTVASAFGAYKSNQYYKKSKYLTKYANTNIAFMESQKIISGMTEILKLGSVIKRKGINYENELRDKGENIKRSMNTIRESLSVEDYRDVKKNLDQQQPRLEEYIDSLIIGSVMIGEKFKVDDNFNKCQQAFCDMQLLLKEKIEIVSESLK